MCVDDEYNKSIQDAKIAVDVKQNLSRTIYPYHGLVVSHKKANNR